MKCYEAQSFADLRAAVAAMDFPDARLTAPVLAPDPEPMPEMPLCRPTRGSIYLAHVWPIRGGCARCDEPFPPFPFQ